MNAPGPVQMRGFPPTMIYCYSHEVIKQVHYWFATTQKPSLSTFVPQGAL